MPSRKTRTDYDRLQLAQAELEVDSKQDGDADLTSWAGVTRAAGFDAFAASMALTDATGLPTTGLVDDAVTNAKLANMAQSRVKMRAAAAGTGDPIDGTMAQLLAAITAEVATSVNLHGPAGVEGASRSAAITDRLSLRLFGSGAGPYTFTLPLNATVTLPAGFMMAIGNAVANPLSITADTGVTLIWLTGAAVTSGVAVTRTMATGGWCLLYKYATNGWVLFGGGIT